MGWQDSFDEMVAADLESSFFGTSEFADTITVVQGNAAPRENIACQVVQTTATINEGSHNEFVVSAIVVMVKDDADLGIVDPAIGDYVEWDERFWNFLAVKSADLGTRTITFTETTIGHRGHNKPPSI